MNSFTVQFHKEDQTDSMTVQKLSEEDFNTVTEGGTRHLFEESYLVLLYEEENEDPSACYGFELADFYQFTALHLNDLEFQDELEEQEEESEEEVYGPIHHLAHLLYHIVEEGKNIEV